MKTKPVANVARQFSDRQDARIASIKIREIAEELKPLLPEESQLIIDECVEQFERNDVVVMVAGEVSVGKSSLLNVLLGKPILLTDLTETTAAITYLRSSEGDRTAKPDMAKVTYNDGRIEWLELKKSSLMKVTTSLQNDDALRKVRKVDIYVSGDIIPKGVTIVDTPGLNGGEKHSSLTRREMGLCHAALFLLDASKAGTLTEQIELNHLYEYAPVVLFVLTKWDQVRKANPGKTMTDIKSQYLDSIGKITHDAVKGKAVSAENIYVVSAKEGLDAVQALEADHKKRKKQKGRTTEKIDIHDYLPDKGESNEIFDLFIDLIHILDDETKKRMIRLRPLLTMSNLAKSALENLEEKLAHDVDTSDLDLEIAKITGDLEERKNTIINRNLAIVERIKTLADAEQEELYQAIENMRQQVIDDVSNSLQETPAVINENSEQLLGNEFHQSFQKKLNSILTSRILNPLQQKVDDFLTLLNNSFDSGEEVSVNIPARTMPSVNFSAVSKKKQQISEKVQSLKDSQSSIKAEIANLKKQYAEVLADYNTCSEAREKVESIDKKISSVEEELENMGTRPGADQD